MSRRRDERTRVLGPHWIESKRYWRVVTIDPGATEKRDRRRDRYFGSQQEAVAYKQLKEQALARLEGTTVKKAMEAYRPYLERKGNAAVSVEQTMTKLGLFFPDHDQPLSKITPEKAAAYYVRTDEDGQIIGGFVVGRSVDYHRNTLAETKTFLRWCVAQKWLKTSPLEGVEGIGKRNAGKPQLTGDEAHRFLFAALWMAHGGDLGALGVAMLLSMALRQKDVSSRLVRDVDLGGSVLRVEKGKTAKSNRPRKVPLVLRSLLRGLTTGRSPLEPLFVTKKDGGFHTKSWLRSAAKRVAKVAGVQYVCPHGLKGTAGTLAIEAGALADHVVDFLSHTSMTTSGRHYIAPGALEEAQQQKALRVLQRGG
jgi:integrase